ncbi:hypothetical protein AB1N83_013202 [Pleurotus pulmonarius]
MITFATAHNFLLGCVNGFAIFVVVGEVYAIRIMAVAGTAPVIPSMGLATALFTVMSIPAMLASPPNSFMKTVVFETLALYVPVTSIRIMTSPYLPSQAILWVLWLVTASLTPGMMKILGADARDSHIGGWRILCDIEPDSYRNCIALMFYIVFLSVLTVKAIIEGHPNVWMASSLDIFTYPDGEDTDSSPKAAGDWIGNKATTALSVP